MELTLLGDYFLENNILHKPGKCLDEKFMFLPIHISSDFKETKCGLKSNNMEFKSGGTYTPSNEVSFCTNCRS